ncbi:MAG TPA: hypothetical protein ENL07_04660 [Chlorobaculum parvum]|uniref:Tetratricopeptide repeat-like domain-containing protein n=1 Tax=Chlorobaculum parvum TaxID=274539 RepID=A0A7C5HEN7_9CHLB|nr:hypothetical protein [Chlorobaculum parvum]
MNTTPNNNGFDDATLADNWLEIVMLHKNKIIALVSIILIVGGGIFYWIQKSRVDEEQAALALSKLTPAVEAASETGSTDNEALVSNMQTIIKRWGYTPSGNKTKLYLATLWFNAGKTNEALVLYDKVKSDNKDMQASAIAGSAACHVQDKKFAKAATAYAKASETAENEALKAMYLNKAAESYVLDKQPAEAVKRLEQVIKSWSETSSAVVAQRTLWRLEGSGVPVPQL